MQISDIKLILQDNESALRMRVLMATPGFYPIIGGTEVVVRNLSKKLNDIGIDTDIMTFNMDRKWEPKWSGKIETIDGLKVIKIPALNWFPMTHSNRITMGINLIPGRFTNVFKHYDIIHFHEDLSFPLFSYGTNKPKIFHLHGLKMDFFKRYFISKLILKNVADLYLCITKRMKNDLTKLDIPEEKIKWLPNGVDVNLFRPVGEKKDNLLLFVGRICAQKGLHVLLKSLVYLKKPVHLVIIGPSDYDPIYYKSILSLIEKENRRGKHKITYLGELNREAIIKWYQKASIFILPSIRDEALGIVNLEALSCETPVVATNVGGVSEGIYNGVNGILVPPNESIELSQAIQYLLDNEDVWRKFSKEGRKWVITNFSIEVIVKRLFEIYKEISSN